MPGTTVSSDRRVLRTRLALRDALIALMLESGWDALNVQDICARANVGRSTFYLHFQGKEELLAGSLADLREALRAQAMARGETILLGFVRGLIEHVHEQRPLFRAVIGRRSGHVVQMRFREMVTQLVADGLSKLVKPGWQRDAAIRYVSGALVELLAWWVDAKSEGSAMDLEAYFFKLTQPVIEQLA